MSRHNLRCECCGAIQWGQAPRLNSVRMLAVRRGAITSREVASEIGISIANASNQLDRLAALGVVRVAETRPLGTSGGIEHVYELVVR